jgi:hypothetical protein
MSEEPRISFGQLTHLLLGNFKAFKRTQRIPIRPITLKVAVLYVENLGKESVVREMSLNEKGELIRDRPGGFFENSSDQMAFLVCPPFYIGTE